MKIAMLCLMLSGCAPWNVDAVPAVKKCNLWVRVNEGPWKCVRREEFLPKVIPPTN